MPPGKVSRYPRKTRKPGAPARSVARVSGNEEQLAQNRYEQGRNLPQETSASLRARAAAVARTPGAAESMAQAVNAWNKPKPPATEPPVDPAARARAMKRRSGDAEAMAQERYDMRGERYAPKTETEKVIPYRAAGKTYYGLEAERRRKVAELSPEAKAKVQRVAGQKPKPKPVVKKQGKRSAD